ncbi:MAG TPA: cytochrome c peroxidase [Kofleriaceae bacterium]
MRAPVSLFAALCGLFCARAARGSGHWDEEEFVPPPPFQLTSAAIGGARPATSDGPAHAASSRIVAVDDGALVSDADSGMLIRTDATGAATAQLAIGAQAGLLAYDPSARRAYVADRRGDRIVVVDVGDKLVARTTWRTPAEPYAVALTADRKTLLVTTIADRTLVAFDVAGGSERWRTALSAEPRGLAIARDGKSVLVASLASGALDQVALDGGRVKRRALPVFTGQRARGAFAVTFVGDMAVTPYQLERPVAAQPETGDHYGGGFDPPIAHQIAFLGADGRRATATTNVNEPRAIAWDAARDRLYVAGLAIDEIASVDRASQIDVGPGKIAKLGKRCGADGLAIGRQGSLFVWCSFTRSVARFDLKPNGTLAKVKRGPELVASVLDEQRHAGMVLFHTANDELSSFGGMSCGACHLEGRADGLSWLIGGRELQTPVLAGRIAGTAPFKWDGTAKDLQTSLRQTIGRLGGSGLSKQELGSLVAFIEAMPAVRAPTRDAKAVARGKQLFESNELGCASCHDGASFTDRDQHQLGRGKAFDTPSLTSLAASAPYFHDGSAATLEEALRDRGRVHGMSDAAMKLDGTQLAQLVAFLETL